MPDSQNAPTPSDRTRIPSVRISPERATVDSKLGFLAELAGTWEGQGFNLIARPDRQGGSPLFLELNQTFEVLSFIPISSSIPNRGSAVDDIELFGLTYLQKVSDSVTKGALHIEPGIWIHIPSQDTNNGTVQSVARMGTIPHGNSLLAQGTAIQIKPFNGNPFDPDVLSAVNTSPFPWRSGCLFRARYLVLLLTTFQISHQRRLILGRPQETFQPSPCPRLSWEFRCRMSFWTRQSS